MPWHIETDHADCSGFAVIKDATGEVVGCHRTRNQANAQLAALHIAEPDMRDLDAGETWTPKQQALYAFYEQLVETTGMFTQGVDGNGAHYGPSPFASEGLVCANCSFYEGGRHCEIVEGDIDPGAICKLWIINQKLTQQRAGSGPATIIVDIDGTLAINGGVNNELVKYLNDRPEIKIVVTGRSETQRESTARFLDSTGLEYRGLRMSSGGNVNTYKRGVAEELMKTHDIVLAVENNPETRKTYEEIGIRTMGPQSRRETAEQILASLLKR